MIQETKATWLQEGDENSCYFHSVLKKRHYQARIVSITQQGVVVIYKKDVIDHFVKYYEQLQGTSAQKTCCVRSEVLNSGPRLDIQQQVCLIGSFTAEDIKRVVFSIHNAKSPGHDGYTSSFFKENWRIIGMEIREAVMDFYFFFTQAECSKIVITWFLSCLLRRKVL